MGVMGGSSLSLTVATNELIQDNGYDWAWTHFKETLVALAQRFGVTSVLEIGGGRSPTLTSGEARSLRLDLSINDISPAELERCADDFAPDHRLLFDISGEALPAATFDMVFSKTVLEHVSNATRAHRNTLELLRPGGIAFHFFPTLYCPPFLANRLLPEQISKVVLRAVGKPHEKFPARYDGCTSSRSLARDLIRIGYSEAEVVPFWGHSYFSRIPGLRTVDDWLAAKASERDFRPYSCYCYVIARR
jgi:SAM-dependent methyltransferase